MAFLILRVWGRVFAFDVAMWLSPDKSHVSVGPGFYLLFYVMFYAVPIYVLLWWSAKRRERK
jgi:hypothetical protein